MNEEELALVRTLHSQRPPQTPPAHAIIYRALLGDEAGTPTKAPGDAHELRECLALTDAVPRAARALERLAEADPHWRAVARNYDTLRRNMAHETAGTMLHPWPSGTSRQLHQISARIFNGEDPERIEVPDLAQNATGKAQGPAAGTQPSG